MQEAVQAQPIHVEWIGSEFSCDFTEFVFDLLRHAHIEDTLHQRLD